MEAAEFLNTLFGDAVSPEARIVIWTWPDKRSRFFNSCDEAAAYAISKGSTIKYDGKQCTGNDVYFGVGLMRPGITKGRGKAADVVSITSLWADIDFGDSEHDKPNLPPTEKDAITVITRIGVPPSLIVHSGHGLHAYWILKEPLTAEDGAAQFAKRWGATIQAAARSLNFTVDSVWDLTRVLRVPGTWNSKGKERLQVTCEASSDNVRRYDIWNLEEWMVNEKTDTANPAVVTTVDFIQLGQSLSASKLDALLANDGKNGRFTKTWNAERTDMPDQSPSGYDMALAHFGVQAEWSDQDIANLILEWRRKHGRQPEKIERRRGYLQRTIGKARAAYEGQLAINALDEINSPAESGELGKKKRTQVINALTKALGVPIDRLIQHGKESYIEYELVLTTEERITIGGVKEVTTWRSFYDAIFAATGRAIREYKPAVWRQQVCPWFAAITELQEDSDGGLVGEAHEWLEAYFTAHKVATEQLGDVMQKMLPFVDQDGALHIHVPSLRDFLGTVKHLHLERTYVWRCLRAAGFTGGKVSHRDSSGQILCKFYWMGRSSALEKLSAPYVRRGSRDCAHRSEGGDERGDYSAS